MADIRKLLVRGPRGAGTEAPVLKSSRTCRGDGNVVFWLSAEAATSNGDVCVEENMDPEFAQWIPLLQIITNAVLTIGAICVAAASLVVAYRSNFGWKPIVFVGGNGVRGFGGEVREYTAIINLEIWNRRKYPISIRYIRLTFDNLEIRPPKRTRETVWHVTSRNAYNHTVHVLAPNEHERHEVEVPILTKSLDGLNAPVHIEISYFDPRSNKSEKLTGEHVYRLMPEKAEVFA